VAARAADVAEAAAVNLVDRVLGRAHEEARSVDNIGTIDDYLAAVWQYGGGSYTGIPSMQQTIGGRVTETIPPNYVGHALGGHRRNSIIFSCMTVRQLVFSAVRFTWQRFNNGRPSELFGSSALNFLERPWVGGTTQDLLNRVIQDADLAGNAYWTPWENEMVRLRPDWAQILLLPRMVPGTVNDEGRRPPAQLSWISAGLLYTEDGPNSGNEPVYLPPERVAHYAPLPDPLHPYRGMSWLTPVIREVRADESMTDHKQAYFDNGATGNIIVSYPEVADPEMVRRFAAEMESSLRTPVRDSPFRTLHIGGGADATVVGANLQQVEFHSVQGHGETRIAAAAGVPPIIVGLSEGLESATYSNYAQARRRFADGTMHPLWQNVAGTFEQMMTVPPAGVRLWYDTRDVPFLREDEKDQAQILFTQAQTMAQLVNSGYEPESVSRAVLSGDYGLLKHTGFYSVQLRPPGEMAPAAGGPPPAAGDGAGETPAPAAANGTQAKASANGRSPQPVG
jgi:phage portal protein BeeE